MIRRLLCRLRGHNWMAISVNWRKHVNLVHLHPMAGYKAVCMRCGTTWDDLWSPFFGDDAIAAARQPLPEARTVQR